MCYIVDYFIHQSCSTESMTDLNSVSAKQLLYGSNAGNLVNGQYEQANLIADHCTASTAFALCFKRKTTNTVNVVWDRV